MRAAQSARFGNRGGPPAFAPVILLGRDFIKPVLSRIVVVSLPREVRSVPRGVGLVFEAESQEQPLVISGYAVHFDDESIPNQIRESGPSEDLRHDAVGKGLDALGKREADQ